MASLRNVICDNCSASYKIDFSKLKKEKNRITCRRCQYKIVIYKSEIFEPENEQAVVNHEDEKTLVEDSESVVESMDVPKLSEDQALSILGSKSSSNSFPNEVSDPTIRKTTPPPTKAATKVSPYQSIVEDLSPAADNNVSRKTTRSSSPDQKSGFQLIAGLVILGLISILVGHFIAGNNMVYAASLAVGVGTLSMAIVWIVSSDFGYVRPNMPVVLGVGGVLGIAMGFIGFDGGTESEPIPEPEEKVYVAPPPIDLTKKKEEVTEEVEVKKTPRTSVDGNAAGTKNLIENIKTTPTPTKKKSESSQVTDPSEELPPEMDLDEPDEDIEDELLIDDMEDLGLDDEPEEKKGRFARKEKEEAKPKPAADVKVDIPTSVLDIIIRNNKDVKGCYIQQRKETGSFPSSVKVIFTLQPNGKVSSAYISDGPYVGSKFEVCLRSAFKGMTFPPFDSNAKPQSLSYTLKL